MDATTELTTQRQTLRLDDGLVQQTIRVEKDTGDLLFDAVAVDKNKKPNRNGWTFNWEGADAVGLADFIKNPVLLYVHDNYGRLPLGRVEVIKVQARKVVMGCRIPSYAQAQEPAELELERLIGPARIMVRDGFLKAVSMGFQIEECEDGVEYVTPWGDKCNALSIKRFSIWELSVCPLGAHEGALIQGVRPPTDAQCQALTTRLKQGVWTVTDEGDDERVYQFTPAAPAAAPETAPLTASASEGRQPTESEFINVLESATGATAANWPAVAQSMAKALGARGAAPDETAYEQAAEAYAKLGKTAPPWRPNYQPNELAQLHAEGYVQIPGVPLPEGAAEEPAAPEAPAPAQTPEEPNADILCRLDALASDVAELQQQFQPQPNTVPADSAEDPAAPEAVELTPEEVAGYKDNVRRAVQVMVKTDPVLCATRQAAVALAVNQHRNRRRK